MIDLQKECKNTVEHPRLKYSAIAKLFFWGMDLITGKKTTYSKARLLETLACIPYREWEIRKYAHITRQYEKLVKEYADLFTWGDIFRRISLDERDHMNNSFLYSGQQEHIVHYEGMPG